MCHGLGLIGSEYSWASGLFRAAVMSRSGSAGAMHPRVSLLVTGSSSGRGTRRAARGCRSRLGSCSRWCVSTGRILGHEAKCTRVARTPRTPRTSRPATRSGRTSPSEGDARVHATHRRASREVEHLAHGVRPPPYEPVLRSTPQEPRSGAPGAGHTSPLPWQPESRSTLGASPRSQRSWTRWGRPCGPDPTTRRRTSLGRRNPTGARNRRA